MEVAFACALSVGNVMPQGLLLLLSTCVGCLQFFQLVLLNPLTCSDLVDLVGKN